MKFNQHIISIGDIMGHVRLRKKYIVHWSLKKRYKCLFTFSVLCLFLYFSFSFFNRRLMPILMEHAEAEVKKISLYIINESIDDEIVNQLDIEELFVMNKSNTTIQSVDFNTLRVNQLLQSINKKVWSNLSAVQQGKVEVLNEQDSIFKNYEKSKLKRGVIYEVPLGVIFHQSLLAGYGPKIPVKLIFSGNMNSYVKTNIKDYGINNAIIEVMIHVEVEEQILLPFTSKKIRVDTDVPLAVKIIEGNVPNYYSTGIKENSPIVSPSN